MEGVFSFLSRFTRLQVHGGSYDFATEERCQAEDKKRVVAFLDGMYVINYDHLNGTLN
jgi:hypothetical protein